MLDEEVKENVVRTQKKTEEMEQNQIQNGGEKVADHETVESDGKDKKKMKTSAGKRLRSALTPNPTLLPLKLAIVFFNTAHMCTYPFLTIHMLSLGISLEHIGLIYPIFPFTAMAAAPIVGFLADKLGSYTRVLSTMILASGLFSFSLLLVPKVGTTQYQPAGMHLVLGPVEQQLIWTDCEPCQVNLNETNELRSDMKCDLSDSCGPSQITAGVCQLFGLEDSDTRCRPSTSDSTRRLTNISMMLDSEGEVQNNGTCNSFQSAPLIVENFKMDGDFPENCQVTCQLEDLELVTCSREEGSKWLTNVLYVVLRCLVEISCSCNYNLISAQTIEMCKREEAAGRTGGVGRQFTLSALATAILSPLIGEIMDTTSAGGSPNYLVPFVGCGIFLGLTLVSICFIRLDVPLPKSNGLAGLKKILTNLDFNIFLFITFVLGNMWGALEIFLFVFMTEEMNAPMHLLGLTLTVGSLAWMIFTYLADPIAKKVGHVNVFIFALAMYAVRFFGYSLVTNPWMVLPFELLEICTGPVFKIALLQFVGIMAPEGLLATMTALVTGIHYSFGAGSSSLIGGSVIALTGSVRQTFRVFGAVSAAFSALYLVYEYCFSQFLRGGKRRIEAQTSEKVDAKPETTEEGSELRTFVKDSFKDEEEVRPSQL